jgi:hypothetical protein
MTDNEKQRLRIAWAIATKDNPQINDTEEMGFYFWRKYADHYLGCADAVISELASQPDEALLADLQNELKDT